MARTNDRIELFRQVLTQKLREHWVLYLIEGIVLVILGVLAILVPMIATIPVTIVIGWLILISGVVGLVTTFLARSVPGFWWSMVSAVVSVVAGIMLLGGPILEEVSLTLLLVVFLTIEGTAWSAYALQYNEELSWTLDLDTDKRQRRSDPGLHDLVPPSRHRSVGIRSTGRHQYAVWWHLGDRDGHTRAARHSMGSLLT